MSDDQVIYTVKNLTTGLTHTVVATHFAMTDPEFEIIGQDEQVEGAPEVPVKRVASKRKKAEEAE